MSFIYFLSALIILGLQGSYSQVNLQDEIQTLVPGLEQNGEPAFVGRSAIFIEYKPDPCDTVGKCHFYMQSSRYMFNATTDTCSVERVCNYLGFLTQQECLETCQQQ
eukprot:TRINITY_DN6683_c0_g2_i1.p6 TRINITY_DN6683_c0_g2~~TRINITY_DN6683_c0_g2_i1.p6  ORF type:complete len:107 (-),score=5.18 TRINITY_DN6683_c0_g2_i1:1020-1340(-)